MPSPQDDERTQLLDSGKPNDTDANAVSNTSAGAHIQQEEDDDDDDDDDVELVAFTKDDKDDPKNWPLRWKYLTVFLVFLIGLICPMSSSIFAPGLDEIAEELNTQRQVVTAAQSSFVCLLGIGPLFFAPMSETFGRRIVFLTNLVLFTLVQIPSALAPNVESFIVFRALAGLFASVGVANGGGSISDMFEKQERATVLGVYLLGPLLGPTVGPVLGGLLLAKLNWRYLFWVQFGMAAVVTIVVYFLLHETRSIVVLESRKQKLENEQKGKKFKVDGQSDLSIFKKITGNSTRACKILFEQPIVLTMSAYQALIFSTMYTLYTNYSKIWTSPPYNFNTVQLALSYLAPAVGFLSAAAIIVPFLDRVYNSLAKKYNDGEGKPEYRLPFANIGALFLPVSLFWFGWTVEFGKPWPVPLSAMLFFGASQVSIFNCTQNYYIDAFEDMAASALAAGAFLRSVIGGLVPLFIPSLFEAVGYGWGMSVFGFIAALLMPAPLLFFYYGARIRERFAVDV